MKKMISFITLLLLMSPGPAIAHRITEPDQISPQVVIDFNDLAGGPVSSPFTISGVTFTGTLHLVDTDDYQASMDYPTYVSGLALGIPQIPTPTGPAFRINFDSPVAQVGFGIFDPNFEGNEIIALGPGGVLEATTPDSLFSMGGYGADYVGFSRNAADILYIDILPAIFGENGDQRDSLWVDNLSISTTPIPVPNSILLIGTGLISLAGVRRKLKQ